MTTVKRVRERRKKTPRVHLARSRGARMAYLASGHMLLGLGIAGFVLPVMPGVVFLIGAAACYARGSQYFYRWLLTNRWLGPPVREWEEHRAMTIRAKIFSIAMVLGGVGVSVVYFVQVPWLRIVMVVVALCVTLLILTINTYKPAKA
jgi:uncharacterized membrane protein YbaN (DUF454 family)